MLELLTQPEAWLALLTLTALEIVLGIDNIIFISILVGKLPEEERPRIRNIGLMLAMVVRILLLFSLSLIMRLTDPIFTVLANEISGRDLILLAGGLFLIAKSTFEIHDKLEGPDDEHHGASAKSAAGAVLFQIIILDIIFSLDSVITAIGMTDQLPIMVAAVAISVLFMLKTAKAVGDFVEEHPTIKILALSFLILIGVALLGEGLDLHIPKGYIYFAMAFSVIVEMLNLRLRRGK